MSAQLQQGVTELLVRWNTGDPEARKALMDLLYSQLRLIAKRALKNERAGPILQPTLLVNEAYLKLVDTNRIDWRDRGHFLAVATRIMREILVDEARRSGAKKRDWGRRVTFTGGLMGSGDLSVDVLALNDALEQLDEMRPDLCQVVELRFFSGLTIEETAQATGLSDATVNRQWRAARAWLAQALGEV